MVKQKVINKSLRELEILIEENFDDPKVIQLLEKGLRLYKRKQAEEKKKNVKLDNQGKR